MYNSRDPSEDPPCEDCKVEPSIENTDAIRIFNMERYQLIMGQGGAIDMNHDAFHKAMRLYRIKNRRECYEKILVLGRWWIDRLNQKSE